MAKNHTKASQQRAKKKHQKTVARKKATTETRASEARAAANAAEVRMRARPKTQDEIAREAVIALRNGYAEYARKQNVAFYLAARELGSLVEQLDEQQDITTSLVGRGTKVWTFQRVAALSTEEIVGQLRTLGIEVSPETIGEGATGRSVAKWAQRAWQTQLHRAKPMIVDFALMAACELWKRWKPEAPHTEALLSQWLDALDAHHAHHQEHDHGDHEHDHGDHDHGGHDHDHDHNDAEHLEAELVLEELLRPWFAEMPKTEAKAQDWLGTPGLLGEWTGGLYELAQDLSSTNPDLARRTSDALGRMAEALSEDRVFSLTIAEMRADILIGASDAEAAKQVLRENIERRPDEAEGYLLFADILEEDLSDAAQALATLEEALKRSKNGADFDLEARIAGMRSITDRNRPSGA